MSKVRFNVDDMKKLGAALHSARSARVRVGVLGNKAERRQLDNLGHEAWDKENFNNPTLGFWHEFGIKTKNLPARSFLRLPLMTELPKHIATIGRAFWRNFILKRDVPTALKALGVEGENTVQRAFETQGFGAWPQWSAGYASFRRALEKRRRAKNTHGKITGGSLLILSGQLRRSITSRVEMGKAKP